MPAKGRIFSPPARSIRPLIHALRFATPGRRHKHGTNQAYRRTDRPGDGRDRNCDAAQSAGIPRDDHAGRAELRDHIPVRSFKPSCRRRHRPRSQCLDRRLAGDRHDIGLALDRRRCRPHVVSKEGFGNRHDLRQRSDTSSCGGRRSFGARSIFVVQGLRHDDLKEAIMNKITRSSDLIAPKVTTGPLPASTKIYTSPAGRNDLRVPFREIALTDTSEPSFRVYDPSGPYTDPAAAIDVERGLPRIRDGWVKERGGVEAYDGRVIRPEDNGNVSGSHAARAFPNVHQPVRGTGGAPVTQYEYARAGIVTKEMIYVAHRENLGRQTALARAKEALNDGESFGAKIPEHITPEFVRDQIARGRAIIPANINH